MINSMKIAVCSRSFSAHPVLRRELLDKYEHVQFNDAGASLKDDALVDFVAGHDAMIVGLERVNDVFLARLPDLRVVAKYGVGLDGIDTEAMRRRGVALGWTAGVNRRSVVELSIAFMISLLRHVPVATSAVKNGEWRQLVGRQLSDRTVGIIGCGHVGKDLARLLRAFGCRVLAHDVLDFPQFYHENGIEPVSLDELLSEAEIVSLHVPLDDTTRNMLDAERLTAMRDGALLINTARGGLVDEGALKELLSDGHLAGAAFDVFADEPPTDLELLNLPNLIATPHIGGSAEEAVLAMGRAAIDGLKTATVPGPG